MSASSSRARATSYERRKRQETSPCEELKLTVSWGGDLQTRVDRCPAVCRFSAHHPMIPRRYVPPWQTDMENRKLIVQTCKLANNFVWKGHISYFLEGRERLNSTSYQLHSKVLNYSRNLQKSKSHLSKFNSSVMAMA